MPLTPFPCLLLLLLPPIAHGLCDNCQGAKVINTSTCQCSHCLPGRYGLRCNYMCSGDCIPEAGCHQQTGLCYECLPGRAGPKCRMIANGSTNRPPIFSKSARKNYEEKLLNLAVGTSVAVGGLAILIFGGLYHNYRKKKLLNRANTDGGPSTSSGRTVRAKEAVKRTLATSSTIVSNAIRNARKKYKEAAMDPEVQEAMDRARRQSIPPESEGYTKFEN